jgi:hypothetical protein
MQRIIALLGTAWVFTCVPFFLVGDVLLDPSGEYSASRSFWVSVIQWLALLAPPVVLGLAAIRLSKDSDIDA